MATRVREVTVTYTNDSGEVIRLTSLLDDCQIADILVVMDDD